MLFRDIAAVVVHLLSKFGSGGPRDSQVTSVSVPPACGRAVNPYRCSWSFTLASVVALSLALPLGNSQNLLCSQVEAFTVMEPDPPHWQSSHVYG